MAKFTYPELESARFQAGDVVANAVNALKESVEEYGAPMTAVAKMPTASAAVLGRVVLFTGATGEVYTQYHRYICTESEDVFSWTDIDAT